MTLIAGLLLIAGAVFDTGTAIGSAPVSLRIGMVIVGATLVIVDRVAEVIEERNRAAVKLAESAPERRLK